MNENTLGDAPIEPEYRAMMNEIARSLDKMFNGEVKGVARTTGFVLLVFPFGDEPKGRCNYISNGGSRRDIAALMRYQIARLEGQPELTGSA